MHPRKKYWILGLVLGAAFCFGVSASAPLRAEENGIQTGLIELDGFKHPVYLFVPEGISASERYPLIISIPDGGEDPKKHAEKWVEFGPYYQAIVLVPQYLRPEKLIAEPKSTDRWIFEIRDFVLSAWPANEHKVYLIGNGQSAAYAFYLGINYAPDFSAVALLGGSWMGETEKMLRLKSRSEEQIPIYVALHEAQAELQKEVETGAMRFQEKGYWIEVRSFKDAEDFSKRSFRKTLMEWFDAKAEEWKRLADTRALTWYERLKRSVKEFFAV